jgi:hypothetical protein
VILGRVEGMAKRRKQEIRYKPLKKDAGFEIESEHPDYGKRKFICVKVSEDEAIGDKWAGGVSQDGVGASSEHVTERRRVKWVTFDQSDAGPVVVREGFPVEDKLREKQRVEDAYKEDLAKLITAASGSFVAPKEVMSACAFSTVVPMVRCAECGNLYSSGIMIQGPASVTLRGNQAQCPQCGRMNPIPDR